MYLPLVDFFIFVFYMTLILLVFNINQGLNLLIVSELGWICLFICYLLQGLLLSSILSYTFALTILIFAAVDCSLWVLILVYFLSQTSMPQTNYFGGIKFMFRLSRLLKTNRFIK